MWGQTCLHCSEGPPVSENAAFVLDYLVDNPLTIKLFPVHFQRGC